MLRLADSSARRQVQRGGQSRLFNFYANFSYSSTKISFFAQISLRILGQTVTLTSPR
jgi:hypothetical protein